MGKWPIRPKQVNCTPRHAESDDGERLVGSSNECTTAPSAHTFDRIQFKRAATNDGRVRGSFKLSVDLYADVRHPETGKAAWVKIASQVSEPFIVRGRSPNYKGKRRVQVQDKVRV